jgi:hypothetical protein
MEYTEKIRNTEFNALIEQRKYKDAIEKIVEEVKYNYSLIQDKANKETRETYELILIYGEELQIDSAVDEKLFEFIKFRREVFIDLFIKSVRGLH